MAGVLVNVRVLDLSRHLAGPSAAQMLGDLGAEVIKVERPREGDDMRGFGPPFLKDRRGNDTRETSSFFAANRGKKSVTLDISTPEGQELARRLAAKCDVVVENFRPGTLDRHGLGFQGIKAVRPDIIYCSITGFGQDGPYRDRAGYDSILQAMGGLMSVNGLPDGEPGGGPMKCGTAIADMVTGLYACVAILGAIVHRKESGCGQHIDLALLDSQISIMALENARFLMNGVLPQRVGNVSRNMVPTQTFKCKDGHLAISITNNRQFLKLVELMGRPDLGSDERYADYGARRRNRHLLIPVLEEIFLTRTAQAWTDLLTPAAIAAGEVKNLKQVFDDPQVRHRKMRIELEHGVIGAVPLVGNPIKYSATPVSYNLPPPMLGEHTREVLRELAGMDDETMNNLVARGII